MSGIFPLREKVSLGEDRDPRLIELDEDVADEVFDALSSRTTRTIFAELHASPQTASDLAEVTDTSVQNAQYHLEKLVAADLVAVVDTWYSERGTEMKVYAPTDEALVLFAGSDTEGALRTLLRRVVGVLAVLLPASAVVAWLADRFADRGGPLATGGSADGAESVGEDAATAESQASTEESYDAEAAGDEAATAERQSGDAGGTADAADSGSDGGDSLEVADTGSDGGDGGGGADGGSGGGDDAAAETPTPDVEGSEVGSNVTTRSNETGNETGSVDVAEATPTPESPGNVTDTPSPGTITDTPSQTTPTDAPLSGTVTDTVRDTPSAVTPTPEQVADAAASTVGGLDPALVAGGSFFLGGAFILVVLAAAWYRQA